MSDKVFITAKTLLEDSFRLAAQVYESGFRPQFIVGIWRGVHQLVSQCKSTLITKK